LHAKTFITIEATEILRTKSVKISWHRHARRLSGRHGEELRFGPAPLGRRTGPTDSDGAGGWNLDGSAWGVDGGRLAPTLWVVAGSAWPGIWSLADWVRKGRPQHLLTQAIGRGQSDTIRSAAREAARDL